MMRDDDLDDSRHSLAETGHELIVMVSLESRCARLGVRLTPKQRTICRVIEAHHGFADIEQIVAAARRNDSRISRDTVRRTFRLLETIGIIVPYNQGLRKKVYLPVHERAGNTRPSDSAAPFAN